MKKLLSKEIRLSASKLSFFFIAFALMTMLPGYPILMGAFFVSFGLFQSFQCSRENSDILYSVLLPVSKRDIVRGKFLFCVLIEIAAFAVMALLTLLRMSVLRNVAPYVNNPLLSANFVFLGFALLIFGCFNLVFVAGFFKTGYYFAKPLICFIIAAMLIITAAEALPHFPSMAVLNPHGFENTGIQAAVLLAGIAVYAGLTYAGLKKSEESFELTDL